MDREAISKQMKSLKSKAKAARKAGKRDEAIAFSHGSARLHRRLKATGPKKVAKKAD